MLAPYAMSALTAAAARRSLTAAAAGLVSPATDGAAADRQLSLLPPHCALQPPVGAPPPPRGLVSKSYCLTSLTPEKQLMTRTLLSTGEVEDSNSPPLVKLKTRTLLS